MKNKKLHQRLTAGILLLAFATAVYAVSGVVTEIGHGDTSAEACSIAKRVAANKLPYVNARVTSYSACDCSKDGSNYKPWICSVDAYWTTD